MDDPIAKPSIGLTARLSRRNALKTYVPPTLSVIGAANVRTLHHSGRTGGNPGGGNPGGGNPGGGTK